MAIKSIQVNGQLISPEELRSLTVRKREQAENEGRVLTPEERLGLGQEAVEALIQRTLLLQEARRLNPGALKEDPDLLIQTLLRHWSREVRRPKLSEVREFYNRNFARFRTAELAWAAHIVKHTETGNSAERKAEVECLRDRVLRGEPFAEVASKHSDCPENGGNLGYFPRGTMVEEFEAVVFSVPLNTITPVFHTCFGYHIAVVYDRKAAGIRALDEIQPEVEHILHLEKQDREIGRRLAALRKRAVIMQA